MYLNALMAEDIRSFDYVVYQSLFSKEMADRYLFPRNNNFEIIYNGTDLTHFRPLTSTDAIPGPFEIVVLGNHHLWQLELAVHVLRIVRVHVDARLRFVGMMRDKTTRVDEGLRMLGLAEAERRLIICDGFVDYGRLPHVLSMGHVMLHVKAPDWCPNAVIEALSCGLPVICPELGGTRELVCDAGVVVPFGHHTDVDVVASDMAEAVLRVISNLPEYRRRAREIALEHFDRAVVTRRYLKTLG